MDAARRSPERPRYEVSLADPGDLAAGLPHLLGFRPRESVLLVGLGGPSGRRIGLTVRVDIPPPGRAGPLASALARGLADSVAGDRPSAVVVAIVSDDDGDDDWHEDRAGPPDSAGLPHRRLVHELVVALAARDIAVRDALLVRRGRWWSYDCPHPCCAPGAGTPLPSGVTALEAASVAAGQVVADDRGDLAARIAPAPDPAGAMAAAVLRAGRECAVRVAERGPDAVAEESWAAVTAAVTGFRPGPVARMSDAEVARVLWALRDGPVRDRALGLALGDDAAAAEQLWTECTRRAPAPLDAAPATLLAVSAWLRGDGALAGIALERARDGDPGYSLAALLERALAACLPPDGLRRLIAAGVDR